ncbi:MAG: UDP-glucose 4-epimerase GalE [Actinomycetota bacterium]|nr:UDP-glucose 4-epimerase GalE [Actinomycetota bacterium]
MSVLVTGGAGYIGSHTVAELRRQGRDVVVLDSLELGHRAAVLDAPLVVGDIADARLVSDTVSEYDVDAVVHFAAYKAAGESMERPERYFSNNVAGTNALLHALQEAGVSRFVFSSSCAVYGTPTELPVSEDHPLGPESPYGESKRMVEQMLAWYDTCHDLRSVSLRYFNAAGASADNRIGEDWTVTLNLVPLVMKAALGRVPQISVYGTDYPTPDGTAIRDYVHVDDLADAHVRALDHLEGGGATAAINLGTGEGSSVRQVIDTARRVSGVDIPVIETGRRLGDPVVVYGDNRRAAEVLRWKPTRGLEEVVSSAWQWHSTHPDGYGAA